MKRLFILFLFIPFIVQAQTGKNYVSNVMHEWVKQTELDTSTVHNTHSNMTYRFWAGDTTGADSVDFTYYFDVCTNVDSSNWVTIDSTTLAQDSVWTIFVLTEFAISNDPFIRVRSTAGTDNAKDTYVEQKIEQSHWYAR